jgi:hypothetical protein
MFRVAHPVYAWQLKMDKKSRFGDVGDIHFEGQRPPDFFVLFGPVVADFLKASKHWESKGWRYEHIATINTFWKDLYRPELFWRTFRPINQFLQDYIPFCRVCGSNSLAQHCLIEKPVSRAGVFYCCSACEALSFHAAHDTYAYADDYYGCGSSKVGGLANGIRCLSANWRADFVSKLVGKGRCLYQSLIAF